MVYLKIVALIGSPRKGGNTDTLLQKVAEGFTEQGGAAELFYLNDLSVRGCQACYSCKQTGKCVVNDDASRIFSAIDAADAVVIGSPVYFGRFTAQLAPVLDRFFAYRKADGTSSLPPGKKFGLVFTQNQSDPELNASLINSLAQVLGRVGFESGLKPLIGTKLSTIDAAAKNEEYLQAAVILGKELARALESSKKTG